jgi:TRAP-type C4-dicarboxylate transport system permease small subunit
MERFDKIYSRLEDLLAWYFAGILVFASTGYVTANVIGRYWFGQCMPAMADLVGFLLVPIAGLGLAYGWRNRGTFVAAEFLLLRLKGKPRWGLEFFIQIAALFFAIAVGCGSLADTIWSYRINQLGGTPAFWLATWPFKASIALGCLLMAIRIILQIIKQVQGRTK